MSGRRRYGLLAMALLPLALCGQTVTTGDKTHVKLRAIGERLKCQCENGGCAYTVGSCNMLHCPFREEIYEQIRTGLKAGMADDAIIAALKNKYGALILAAPPAEGFKLLGWVMPFLALALGLVVIRFLLLRWRRPAPASPGAAGSAMEKFQEEIEKELAGLE